MRLLQTWMAAGGWTGKARESRGDPGLTAHCYAAELTCFSMSALGVAVQLSHLMVISEGSLSAC